MNDDDLLAALREGVRSGAVPQPISGESIDDYRFRTAHAGAILGIKWAQTQAEAIAIAQFEAAAAVPDSPADLDTFDLDGRHSDATLAPQRPHVVRETGMPPEQNESAGV